MSDPRKLPYTPRSISRLLQVSVARARSMMLTMPHVIVDGQPLVERTAYEAWIESRLRAPIIVPKPEVTTSHPWAKALADACRDAMAALPACCNENGFTYLVEAAGLIKIGKTNNPLPRMIGLTSGSPVPISFVALSRGSRLEWALHTRCAGHRRHGEWSDAAGVRVALGRSLAGCLWCAFHGDLP